MSRMKPVFGGAIAALILSACNPQPGAEPVPEAESVESTDTAREDVSAYRALAQDAYSDTSGAEADPVSYTHLTLPTTSRV